MKRRGKPSLEELSAAIEAIHEAGLDSFGWPAVLQRIHDLFRSTSVAVWVQGSAGDFQDVHALQQADEITRDYAEHYGRLDKLRPAVMRAPVGTILTNEMVISQAEFARTEFYADFAVPHDLLSCMQARVFDGPNYSGYVGIGRTNRAGTFEREDIRLLRLLLPHFGGAQRTRQHLASVAIDRNSALVALDSLNQGVLIVDAQVRVLHANSAAEALLRMQDGLTTTQGRLCAMRSADDAALRRALGGAAGNGGGTLAVIRPSGRAPFAVTVQPVTAGCFFSSDLRLFAQRPAALIFVIDPDHDGGGAATTRTLRALYGLTGAEVAVAAAIAHGQGVTEAAAALGVASSTVRWHLQRVFEKTGTARQADLTRLVERLGTLRKAKTTGYDEPWQRASQHRRARLLPVCKDPSHSGSAPQIDFGGTGPSSELAAGMEAREVAHGEAVRRRDRDCQRVP